MSPLGAMPPRELSPAGEYDPLTGAPFFVGYRHLNRQQKINDLLRFTSGAVCPPRAPPECFSWFYFACALFTGSGKSGQIAPSGRVCWLRPQMLE